MSAPGHGDALPPATYSGREFVCEFSYFQAKALDDKIEVVGAMTQPPSGGLVGVVAFESLKKALTSQPELLYPVVQMLGQNAMSHVGKHAQNDRRAARAPMSGSPSSVARAADAALVGIRRLEVSFGWWGRGGREGGREGGGRGRDA